MHRSLALVPLVLAAGCGGGGIEAAVVVNIGMADVTGEVVGEVGAIGGIDVVDVIERREALDLALATPEGCPTMGPLGVEDMPVTVVVAVEDEAVLTLLHQRFDGDPRIREVADRPFDGPCSIRPG